MGRRSDMQQVKRNGSPAFTFGGAVYRRRKYQIRIHAGHWTHHHAIVTAITIDRRRPTVLCDRTVVIVNLIKAVLLHIDRPPALITGGECTGQCRQRECDQDDAQNVCGKCLHT